MKKLLFLAVITILVGCNSKNTPRDAINDRFPNAEVSAIPYKNIEYLVKDTNGVVWYVRVAPGFDSNYISTATKMFKDNQ